MTTISLTRLDSAFYQIPNVIFISLDEGFDDSLDISINDTLVIHLRESLLYAYAMRFKTFRCKTSSYNYIYGENNINDEI